MVGGQRNATGSETSVEPRPTDATGSGTSVEPRPTADGEWNFRRTATDGRGMGWKKKRGKDGDWYVVKGTQRGVELPSNRDRRGRRKRRGVELSSNRDRRPTDERRRGVELPSNRDRRPTDGRRRGVELPSNRDDDGEWNFRRTATDRRRRTNDRPTDRRTTTTTGSGTSVEPLRRRTTYDARRCRKCPQIGPPDCARILFALRRETVRKRVDPLVTIDGSSTPSRAARARGRASPPDEDAASWSRAVARRRTLA
jgi:hypothetical protein